MRDLLRSHYEQIPLLRRTPFRGVTLRIGIAARIRHYLFNCVSRQAFFVCVFLFQTYDEDGHLNMFIRHIDRNYAANLAG